MRPWQRARRPCLSDPCVTLSTPENGERNGVLVVQDYITKCSRVLESLLAGEILQSGVSSSPTHKKRLSSDVWTNLAACYILGLSSRGSNFVHICCICNVHVLWVKSRFCVLIIHRGRRSVPRVSSSTPYRVTTL